MVIPVGGRFFNQNLLVVTHKNDGPLETREATAELTLHPVQLRMQG